MQQSLHAEHAHVCTSAVGMVCGWVSVAAHCTKALLLPLGFPITDTAMSICCVPHTCSGQAGGPGSGARPNVVAASKLAAELARMGLTAQVAMW